MQKKYLILIICVFFVVLAGIIASSILNYGIFKFTVVCQIEDYENYIKNQKKYYDTPTQTEDVAPIINGFEPITTKCFDFAKTFKGNLTYVTHRTQNYLLKDNGELVNSNYDLSKIILNYDKYIFKSVDGAKIGIKDIFGNILIEAEYDSYQIENDTILMLKGKSAFVFKNDKPISNTKFEYDITLYDEETICKDGYLFDLKFNRLMYKDYNIMSIIQDNMMIISSSDGFLGYISSDGKNIIEPIFTHADDFVNGFANVKIQNRTFVINKTGKIVFESKDITACNFHDGYFCFIQSGKMGVMNSEFKIVVEPIFISAKLYRAYGDYLIDNLFTQKFYSIIKNAYDDRTFKSILPCGEYYICQKTDSTYCLLDKSINIVVDDCEFIEYSHNILMVKSNSKYCFYKRIVLK